MSRRKREREIYRERFETGPAVSPFRLYAIFVCHVDSHYYSIQMFSGVKDINGSILSGLPTLAWYIDVP